MLLLRKNSWPSTKPLFKNADKCDNSQTNWQNCGKAYFLIKGEVAFNKLTWSLSAPVLISFRIELWMSDSSHLRRWLARQNLAAERARSCWTPDGLFDDQESEVALCTAFILGFLHRVDHTDPVLNVSWSPSDQTSGVKVLSNCYCPIFFLYSFLRHLLCQLFQGLLRL